MEIQNIQIGDTIRNYDIYTLTPKNYVGNETLYALLYLSRLNNNYDYFLNVAILEPGKTYSLKNFNKEDKKLLKYVVATLTFDQDRWENGNIIEENINEFKIYGIKFNKKTLNKYIEKTLTVHFKKFFYTNFNNEVANLMIDDSETIRQKQIKNFNNKYKSKSYKLDTKVCNLNDTDFTVPKLTIWNKIYKIIKSL